MTETIESDYLPSYHDLIRYVIQLTNPVNGIKCQLNEITGQVTCHCLQTYDRMKHTM